MYARGDQLLWFIFAAAGVVRDNFATAFASSVVRVVGVVRVVPMLNDRPRSGTPFLPLGLNKKRGSPAFLFFLCW